MQCRKNYEEAAATKARERAPRYTIEVEGGIGRRRSGLDEITDYYAKTSKFATGVLTVPDFTVKINQMARGSSANLLTYEIEVPPTVKIGIAAHELGHLIFMEVLKEFAPDVHAKLLASINEAVAREDQGVNEVKSESPTLHSMVNSYAEQFCDLLGILVSGESNPFAGDLFADFQKSRDWSTEITMPWENKSKPRVNFPNLKIMEYSRMAEFRRLLWIKYRDQLFGKKKARRKILLAVARAMASEIQATSDSKISDQQRNARLIVAVQEQLTALGLDGL
jgi:hypothetical protein